MKLILTTLLVLLSMATWAQTKASAKKPGFYLEYSSSTKTIIIKDNSITIQEWIGQFDNPTSSMPSSRKEVEKKSELSAAKISELTALIKKSGFLSLPKNEYGGNSADRYYPYTIVVNVNGKKKKVLYRSNPAPDTEQAPKAFSDIEKKINEIAESIKN